MEHPARLFNCLRCQAQVIICSDCDHGQNYCSKQCTQTARQIACRAAGKRYQNTRQGRSKHAARQRRYQKRKQQQKKKMTHHTSLENSPYDVLPVESKEGKIPQLSLLPEGNCCHFCKKPVSDFLRPHLLGSDRGNSLTTKLFRRKILIKLNEE